MEMVIQQLKAAIADSEKVLVGLGGEWESSRNPEAARAYDSLYHLIGGTDYFIVTMATDGMIFKSSLDPKRITAPCGNIHWLQCKAACTKDIWEEGEVPDGICPHCKEALIPNTIEAPEYIEEGYLPQWKAYTGWLATTLNRKLAVLELGVGFKAPTVIRWPFEKTVFFNKKAHMYRINAKFSQKTEEIRDRMTSIPSDSVEFLRKL